MKRRATTAHRGFATATALTLLAFVAVLLTAMGAWIRIDAQRTRDAVVDTQLRQLLLAGAAAAGEDRAIAGSTSVPLPSVLADGAARLTIDIAMPSDNHRTATIEAAIADRLARQVVQLSRDGSRWTLVSAAIDPE